MINSLKRLGLALTDLVSTTVTNHYFDDFKRLIIPAPGFTTLHDAELLFWAEFKQCFAPNGLFLYSRPVDGEPLDFGDTALHHGLATAILAFRYRITRDPETREMLISAVKASAQLYRLGDNGLMYLIRGVDANGATREDVSNDSCTGHLFGLYAALNSDVDSAAAWASDQITMLALELCQHDYSLVGKDGKPTSYGKLINGALTAPPLAALCLAVLKVAALRGKPSYSKEFQDHFTRVWDRYGSLIDLSDFKFLWLTKTHEAHRAAMNLWILENVADARITKRARDGLARIVKLEGNSANWWILALAGANPKLAAARLSEIDPATRPLRVERRNSLDAHFWESQGVRFFQWGGKTVSSQPLPPWKMGSQDFMPQRDLLSVDDNAGETSQHHRYSGHDFLLPYWLMRYELFIGDDA
jgi:hypothetical protein